MSRPAEHKSLRRLVVTIRWQHGTFRQSPHALMPARREPTLPAARSPSGIPLTRTLIAANIAVFVATLFAGAGLWHGHSGVQLAWGANFGPATQDGQWWRLLSAMFLHFGALHLLLNLGALWDGGRLVERSLGSWRFAIVYLTAGLTGNLSSLVASGGSAVSGGASGAIFGVYAAWLVCLWDERRRHEPREFRWLLGGAAAFCSLTLVLGALVPGIDQAAHLGGFAAGGLVAIAVRTGRRRAGAALAIASLAALSTGLAARLPEPGYRWSDEQAARTSLQEFVREDLSIREEWQHLLRQDRHSLSFEELAGRLEDGVADRYEESFEHLSMLHVDPRAPSARRLEAARRYAEARRDEALRAAGRLRSEALRQRAENPAQQGNQPSR